MLNRPLKFIFVLLITSAFSVSYAYDPNFVEVKASETPKELEGTGITEKLGAKLSLSREFKDEEGQLVKLQNYFKGDKPVMLAMVYYSCPNLCNYQLNGLVDTLKKMKWQPGKEFELVAVSMNHNEDPTLASKKMQTYIDHYGRPETKEGWHFLTGTEENVKALADEIGFGFKWDEKQKQFAHSAATQLISPDGVLTRYLYGIDYDIKTLKLGITEAAKGTVGTIIDRLILTCFEFDPTKNKYTIYAYNVMKAGASVTLVVIAIFLVPAWLRRKKGSS